MKLATPEGEGAPIPAIRRAVVAGVAGARIDEIALYGLAPADLGPVEDRG